MTISVDSSTDSKEAVTAALGDLANAKPVEEKTEEKNSEVKDESTEANENALEEDVVTDDAESSESDEKEDETEELEAKDDETQKPKKKGGFQKKLERKEKQISLLEQEREYWRTEALRTKSATEVKQAEEIKPDLSKRPKSDDFQTHDDYVEALTDWKLDQKLLAKEQKQKENAIKTDVETKINQHRVRVSEYSKTKDDWDEITDVFNDAKNISLTIQEAIVSSENGPAMLYELGKDPKELKRIAELTPIQAAMALGKIEARISKPDSSIEKKTTKAPPPISPVRTRGASAQKSIHDESLGQREWERLRTEQIKQNNLRR